MEDNDIIDSTAEAAAMPSEGATPIQSRFLFVDVAALRAKQLRRGARLRFGDEPGVPPPHKAERAAMEEVRRGLVPYAVPEWRGVQSETSR
jgi:DNA-directed RNA polymerase subunit K/omega